MNKPSATTDLKDQGLDKPAEKRVSTKRTDVQVLVTTEGNRQVNASTAYQITAATEDTLYGAIRISTAAIEEGANLPLASLVDAALLRTMKSGLLHYAPETRLKNSTK